jgi:hypothetical protein
LEKGTVGSIGFIFGERNEERSDSGTEGEGIECDFKNIIERFDRWRRQFENVT